MPPSAFDELLESVRSSLNARRAEVAVRVSAVDAALRAYERALEFEIAEAYASEHELKQPARAEHAADAARELARVVAALPELAGPAIPEKAPPVSRGPASNREAPSAAVPRPRSSGKLVIIGALAGREKSSALPAEFALDAEWIDTERDGVHAVGNLPQRIRQGRVAAVVILDRIVSHKHTEPVVAAARDANVPVAFAGQGGKASLARAIAQIEEMRRERG